MCVRGSKYEHDLVQLRFDEMFDLMLKSMIRETQMTNTCHRKEQITWNMDRFLNGCQF